MAVTPSEFVANYPEFAEMLTTNPAALQNVLDDAYKKTPVALWTTLTDEGAQLRAAQALAQSPFARNLELANNDGKTVYDARLAELVDIIGAGGTVL